MVADSFAAGGTSLQVFRSVALILEAIGVHISAAEFIADPTALQVAGIVKRKQLLEDSLDLDVVHANDWPDRHRPVSSGQESLYVSFLLNPDSLEVGRAI